MDLAVRLAYQVPGVLEERFHLLSILVRVGQEKVVLDDLLGSERQALLRALKVKLELEPGDELRQRVLVLVRLALDGAHDLLERVRSLLAGHSGGRGQSVGDDDGEDEVSEEVGAGRSDGGEVRRREEEFEEGRESVGVVEVDEKRPVEEPASGLELSEVATLAGSACTCAVWQSEGKGRAGSRVDQVPDLLNLLEGGVPRSVEDVGGKLSPVGGKVEVGVGGEDEEVVKVLRGSLVVSVGELVLSEVVERQD